MLMVRMRIVPNGSACLGVFGCPPEAITCSSGISSYSSCKKQQKEILEATIRILNPRLPALIEKRTIPIRNGYATASTFAHMKHTSVFLAIFLLYLLRYICFWS